MAVLAVMTLPGSVRPSGQAQTLPAELSDRAFWALIGDLSEPDGFFEDENYVSNELGYERSMRRLQDAIEPGGVFVGVGPEQNFHYAAALKPAMVFVIDIRRQNAMQHLMYKALFELSADRVDFVSRLFSRARPAGLSEQSSIDDIFRAYAAAPVEPRLFDDTLRRLLALLTERHQFPLSAADRASLTKVFTAFRESGPELMYVFRGSNERHPTYAQMMTAKDETGRSWSYLASTAAFEHARTMQRRNLIVPVVGDFAGPNAVRAVGRYVREHGATVDVFYTSNVESYLFRENKWEAFYDSLLTMPFGRSAVVVRTFFGAVVRECASLRPTIRSPVVASVQPLLQQYRGGKLATQCDLIAGSR
jgi:hypothetical protein